MNALTRSLSFIVIAIVGFSCSEDDNPYSTSVTGSLSEAEISVGLFNEFLQINESSFASSGNGFNFIDQDWCASPSETNIDGTHYDLQNLQCYKGPYQNFQSGFYMANVIDNPGNGNTLFLTFQYGGFWFENNNEPPPTGTYAIEYYCNWIFCYRNFVLTLYTLDARGQVIQQYDGLAEEIHVVNENSIISVNFEATFISYATEEQFPVSATLACCN